MKLRISLENQTYDVQVEILPEPGGDPMAFEPRIKVPDSVLYPPLPADTRPEDKILRSPIAGVVVSVAASVGQKVREGDPMLVIEAMKMQSTVGAPVDGTVDTVHVVAGESVMTGQPLCTLV
jgi:glutaconyl-CoA/methylmalonyl-CoA decarboxylase subunit gamma